jgi:hypothetical protein
MAEKNKRDTEWQEIRREPAPDPLEITFGGISAPTVLYFHELVVEQRRRAECGGAFEVRSRREIALAVDARDLGPEIQTIARCCGDLHQTLENTVREAYTHKKMRDTNKTKPKAKKTGAKKAR